MNACKAEKLGDVCNFIGGSQPPKSTFVYDLSEVDEKDYVRLIQIRDYKSDKHVVYILKSCTKKFCTKDDIMIGRYGPPVFQILKGLEGAYNVALMKAVSKTERLDKGYLFRFLESPEIQNYIVNLSQRAAGQTGVNKPALHNYPILVPSIPEQKRIVDILDQAFADIELACVKTEQNLKNARELFESYLQQEFSQRGEGWKEMNVNDVLTLEYGKPLDKDLRKDNGLYPAYGANGIKARSDEYYCDKLSIIVGRKGSAGELTLTEEKYWPLDVTYFVKFDESKYDLQFIYYMLSRLNLPSLAIGVKPGINRNVVYAIKISMPGLALQKKIAKKLKILSCEITKIEEAYNKKLSFLDELKKSILQKAFAGELTNAESKGAAA